MSKEDLLKPRYLVIAKSFRDEFFEVGEVLTLQVFEMPKQFSNQKELFVYKLSNSNGSVVIKEIEFQDYPHLFRKLEWWEMRDEKDLPEYVKPRKATQYIFKLKGIEGAACSYIDLNGSKKADLISVFLPATEQEYLNYINQNK